MTREPERLPAPLSPGRLWAEQLAAGMAMIVGLLSFMAFFHPKLLSVGSQVLTTGYLAGYGWSAAVGVLLQLVFHEAGTLVVARAWRLPLRFRLFPFGAHATAILEPLPRHVWRDAVVGFAGPITGVLVSGLCAIVFHFTENPFFLGMACVGYFYNLFTLIPILDLEGGWIFPALPPPALLLGLVAAVLELTHGFNLLLLGVVCFGVPRFVQLLWARAPRSDLGCTGRQKLILSLCYFILVLSLAWFSTSIFERLSVLVPEAMSD